MEGVMVGKLQIQLYLQKFSPYESRNKVLVAHAQPKPPIVGVVERLREELPQGKGKWKVSWRDGKNKGLGKKKRDQQ